MPSQQLPWIRFPVGAIWMYFCMWCFCECCCDCNNFWRKCLLTGAEEACWAHNPKVLGSKPRWAIIDIIRLLYDIWDRISCILFFSPNGKLSEYGFCYGRTFALWIISSRNFLLPAVFDIMNRDLEQISQTWNQPWNILHATDVPQPSPYVQTKN